MDAKIFELLKNKDPEERKKGVRALAQSENREAIPILAKIYTQDPDEEVREMALRAGRHVKKQLHASKWETSSKEIVYAPVSDENKREAKRLMNKALQSQLVGEMDDAEASVRRAFQLNPNLQHEPDPRRIAADVLGLPEDEALDELLGS